MKRIFSAVFISLLCAFAATDLFAEIRYEVHHGLIEEKYIPQLLKFDRNIFCDYPYLFVVTPEYESWYWAAVSTPTTILVLAFDGDVIIGELVAHSVEEEEGRSHVISKHSEYKPKQCLYMTSIAVEKTYQRQGIARQLIKHYENAGREHGYTESYHMAIVRSKGHPFEPVDKFDLDHVWERLGFTPVGIYESWLWLTRVGKPGDESIATIDNMVQYWHKKI